MRRNLNNVKHVGVPIEGDHRVSSVPPAANFPGCITACPFAHRTLYGVVVVDWLSRVTWCDPRFLQMIGSHERDVIGLNLVDLFAKKITQSCEDFERIEDLEPGEQIESELCMVSSEKNVHWFRFELEKFKSACRERGVSVGFLKDITAFKKIGLELRSARERAERASQAKSEFLANMSHELRTPLNAILGYTNLLIEEAGESRPEQVVADLERIDRAGQHLLGLIDDILNLTRIEAGHLKLEVGKFDLRELIEEVAGMLLPKIENKGNLLHLDLESAVGTMWGDRIRIKQCLVNLLGNAAKFTSEGELRLRVREQLQGEEDFIEIQVIDTGIGMTLEQQRRVFQRFEQGSGEIAVEYGGSGLGLSITQKLVHLMGGDIALESESDVGTTFTLILPRISPVGTEEQLEGMG